MLFNLYFDFFYISFIFILNDTPNITLFVRMLESTLHFLLESI
jgi:hypothetical protein